MVRTAMGLSRERVARWANVSEDRVTLYEAKVDAVRPDTAAKLRAVYEILDEVLGRLEALAAPARKGR